MKNLRVFVCFAAVLVLSVPTASFVAAAPAERITVLTREGWDPLVRETLNDMMARFGKLSPEYDPSVRPYAVFDFDNTVSILDVEEQLAVYQLENLRFGIPPEKMYEVLTTGIPDINKSLGEDRGNLSVARVAADAAAAYKRLWDKGYVAADGSRADKRREWLVSDDWKEFAAKARWLYDAIGDTMDVSVSYPWITYWFSGMTPKQVYSLALEAFTRYAEAGKDPSFWQKKTWRSPASYPGAESGQLSVTYNQGIAVSPELRELFAALDANGIDVWVCSASYVDVINAAVAAFDLPGVDGVIAMTNKKSNGVYINRYDYDFHAQTQGVGKARSLDKLVRPLYRNAGPLLVAFDSQGDFNFSTEYKDTVVGLGLNRARSDDAGLLAAVAVFQKERGMTLDDTLKSGDTLYLLQGRDENVGKLWSRPETQALGRKTPLLLSVKAETWLKMLRDGMTPRDLLNKAPELTGKLRRYDGYKNR